MTTEERYAAPVNLARGRIVREVDEPIRVGSMLWVFTDPHKGHELAYNRWYERDHYYAGCMIGASNFAGSRWVATRRHKDARFPEQPDMPFAVRRRLVRVRLLHPRRAPRGLARVVDPAGKLALHRRPWVQLAHALQHRDVPLHVARAPRR